MSKDNDELDYVVKGLDLEDGVYNIWVTDGQRFVHCDSSVRDYEATVTSFMNGKPSNEELRTVRNE